MEKLKEICEQFSKWKTLEEFILRLDTHIDNGPLVVDNCKCIIESICKTILEDLGIDKTQHKTKLHELTQQTVEKLQGIKKSPELTSALILSAQKIGEFRNQYTVSGHGQSIYSIETNKNVLVGATIQYFMSIIEQTALFLITVYQDEYPSQIQSKMHYEDNPEFNNSFDELSEPIQIGGYGPYSPSEVLFYIDNNAYKSELNNQ